jgi:hypothetical protein
LSLPILMGNSAAQLELGEKLENRPVFMRCAENPSLSARFLISAIYST